MLHVPRINSRHKSAVDNACKIFNLFPLFLVCYTDKTCICNIYSDHVSCGKEQSYCSKHFGWYFMSIKNNVRSYLQKWWMLFSKFFCSKKTVRIDTIRHVFKWISASLFWRLDYHYEVCGTLRFFVAYNRIYLNQ